MVVPEYPANESERLLSLHKLGLLDTEAEERFDRITRLAQRLFGVPFAVVSLVDKDRQWFKSRQGLLPAETPRDVSFCGHAILGDGVMEVPDATVDARFADNPLVTEQPNVRFYAGCPISSPDGSVIGTLCLLDSRPRSLAAADLASLRDLAGLVEHEIAVSSLAGDDELTGLANRRGFMVMANQSLALCQRHAVGALVVYADVNGLKIVNDTHGHKAGDRLLCQAAAAMADAFRQSDVVARLGGDEFAAFLPSYAGGELEAVKRLAAAVDAGNRRDESTFVVSMAVGTAHFDPKEPQTLETLLHDADVSMYAHKLCFRLGLERPTRLESR